MKLNDWITAGFQIGKNEHPKLYKLAKFQFFPSVSFFYRNLEAHAGLRNRPRDSC